MNAMFCAEQIVVPPELGLVLKQFTKAAIRDSQGQDVYKWAANYFAGQCSQPPPFDRDGRLLSADGAKPRTATAGEGGMVTDVLDDAHGFEPVDGGAASDETDAIVAQLFAEYDTNGNGRLDRSELPKLIADLKHSLGLDISDEQMHEFMSVLDADDDGTVDLAEFKQFFFQTDEDDA